MGARAGQFDRVVVLRRPSEVPDEMGGVRTVYVDVYVDVWARRVTTPGSKSTPADVPTAVVPTVFEIRFRDGVSPKWIVASGGREYEIQSVEEGRNRRETLVLTTIGRDIISGAT